MVRNPIVSIQSGSAWKNGTLGDGAAYWFSGYLYGKSRDELARDIAAAAGSAAELERVLLAADGHFAIIVATGGRVIATVDRVQSIPLFFARDGEGRWQIGNVARRLLVAIPDPAMDEDAVLAFAMAGFTTGRRTLFRDLNSLVAGECVVLSGADEPRRHRWYKYRPWLARPRDRAEAGKVLSANLLACFEKLLASVGDRQIVVPLSAGLDSRLVASALRHLGRRDVLCVSYGQPGNHEAHIAAAVAERLGFHWIFVPSTLRSLRRYFASEQHRLYRDRADTLQSVPTEQDHYVIASLRQRDELPADAVVVNGQSGDFITGGHVARSVMAELSERADGTDALFQALIAKHFSLWPRLRTAANDRRIAELLKGDMLADQVPLGRTEKLWALYEFSEYQDRQCKHVIPGQRAYEQHGLDWRLPLWDRDFVDFWEGMPLDLKSNQSLYREMLLERNWGDVWRDIPSPGPKYVVPRWIRPLRLAGKAASAPFGRDFWHKMERRFYEYRMGVLCLHAAVPYWKIALSPREGANVMSWINEVYLAEHGLTWDGRKL